MPPVVLNRLHCQELACWPLRSLPPDQFRSQRYADERSQLKIDIFSVSSTGDFAVASNTCVSSINGSAKCAVGVTFTPTAAGARTNKLAIADSAPGSPTLALTGTGNPPAETWGNIKHVIIIFQENRTPHSWFQDPVLIANGADIASSGLNAAGQVIPLTPINSGTKRSNPQFYDISHSHNAFTLMYDGGKMDSADQIR